MAQRVRHRTLKSRDRLLLELQTEQVIDDLVREGKIIDNKDGTYSLPKEKRDST